MKELIKPEAHDIEDIKNYMINKILMNIMNG